ncbi:MAG: VTC domain-containing protein [Eggerthellaceae bacterium]
MTTFTDVFERKEVKYRLDARQHRAMAAALRGRMAPDAFGRTRIVSRYFDTPERALIERSLDKPLYKEKLRLRSYGSSQADDRVFVEIKKKYKGIVYKRRVGCSLAAAEAYLGGTPYEQACMRFPLPDPAMAAESLSPRSAQIAREIDEFIARYRPLRPSMLIECERVAYASIATIAAAAGDGATGLRALTDVPDDLRITFDTRIVYGDLFARDAGAAAHPLLPDGDAVMEIKSSGPFPLWLVRALDACEAYRRRSRSTGSVPACMAAYRGRRRLQRARPKRPPSRRPSGSPRRCAPPPSSLPCAVARRALLRCLTVRKSLPLPERNQLCSILH